jgi:hypothetical protein
MSPFAGFGRKIASFTRKNSPSKPTRSSLQRVFISLMLSSITLPLDAKSAFRNPNSGSAHPAPKPRITLPLENTSRAAACFASRIGFLCATTMQEVPTRIPSVLAATEARVISGSISSP